MMCCTATVLIQHGEEDYTAGPTSDGRTTPNIHNISTQTGRQWSVWSTLWNDRNRI